MVQTVKAQGKLDGLSGKKSHGNRPEQSEPHEMEERKESQSSRDTANSSSDTSDGGGDVQQNNSGLSIDDGGKSSDGDCCGDFCGLLWRRGLSYFLNFITVFHFNVYDNKVTLFSLVL